MLEIAVVGEPKFTMGFRFAGIRKVVDVSENDDVEKILKSMIKEQGLGILIISRLMKEKVSRDVQNLLDNSFSPLVVIASEKDEMGNLRDAIKKAIGVDLWK